MCIVCDSQPSHTLSTGLPQLPLLFALICCFKASVTLTDGTGHTPLSLACKRGEERVAEVINTLIISKNSMILKFY